MYITTGYYQLNSDTVCQVCVEGKYTADVGLTTCTDCPLGKQNKTTTNPNNPNNPDNPNNPL